MQPRLERTTPAPACSSASLTKSIAVGLLISTASLTLHAAEIRMSSTATGAATWRVAGNWSNGAVPTAADDIIFDHANTTSVTSMALHTAPNDTFVARSLTFGSSTGPALGAFSLLNGNSGDTARTLSLTTGAITVSSQVTGTQSLLSTQGAMTLISTDGSFEITNNSSQQLRINANLSDGVAGTSVTFSGSGLTYLDRVNTYTGSTTLMSGANVRIQNVDSLGAGGLVSVAAGSTLDLGNSDANISGLTDHGGAGGTVTRAIATSDNRTLVLNGSGAYSFSGVLNTSGAATNSRFLVRIEGGGTHRFSGANTYGGTTTILNGTFVAANTTGSATGTGNVNIGADGILAGDGFISGTVGTDSGAGAARIAPGDGGAGTLTIGNLNLGNNAHGARFDFSLGTVSSRLHLTGNLQGTPADGSLIFNFSDAGGISAGTIYTLISWEGSANNINAAKFALGSDSIAAGFVLDATYGNGGWRFDSVAKTLSVQFSATPIPEPSAAVLVAGLACVAAVASRRRRSN